MGSQSGRRVDVAAEEGVTDAKHRNFGPAQSGSDGMVRPRKGIAVQVRSVAEYARQGDGPRSRAGAGTGTPLPLSRGRRLPLVLDQRSKDCVNPVLLKDGPVIL